MIVCDTREKKNEHILRHFADNHIDFEVKCVDIADYYNSENPLLRVDRKQNLNELCTNLCSHDRSRFWREIRRARENGIKVVILCEHSNRIKSIEDVASWKNKYGKVQGRDLMEKIYQVHIAYGVDFLFCDKRHTADKLLEVLGYERS